MDVGQQSERADLIARLNDEMRISGRGGRVMVTQGVQSLDSFDPGELMAAIAAYDHFSPANDPYGERDFGVFDLFGVRLYWKIDYYDRKLEFGSHDPANPEVTVRVLTVLLPSEY